MLMAADATERALQSMVPSDKLELHPIGPWLLVRTAPRMEKTARLWLLRVGIEAWYAKGRRVSLTPLRRLPSKTRHKRVRQVIAKEFPAFPGYVLARPVFGLNYGRQICELPGVIGACCFGNTVAKVQDYEVEVLRRYENIGIFDIFATSEAEHTYAQQSERAYKLAGGAKAVWAGQGKRMYRTCESGEIVTFKQNLGRIDRVISLQEATLADP